MGPERLAWSPAGVKAAPEALDRVSASGVGRTVYRQDGRCKLSPRATLQRAAILRMRPSSDHHLVSYFVAFVPLKTQCLGL